LEEGGESAHFYFCLDRGEFVPLCGPLGEEKFRACIRSDATRTKKDMYIPVHRSGLEGIRLQSAHLSQQHISSRRDLEESTAAHRREMNMLRNEARNASDKEQRIVASYKHKCRELEEELLKSRREAHSLHQQVNKIKNSHSHSKGHDEANFQRGGPHFKRLVLVQSVVRSFLARKKAKRAAVAMAANRKGVMQALGKTTQGKTGWYVFSPIVLPSIFVCGSLSLSLFLSLSYLCIAACLHSLTRHDVSNHHSHTSTNQSVNHVTKLTFLGTLQVPQPRRRGILLHKRARGVEPGVWPSE
jgi:hypothetical protein